MAILLTNHENSPLYAGKRSEHVFGETKPTRLCKAADDGEILLILYPDVKLWYIPRSHEITSSATLDS